MSTERPRRPAVAGDLFLLGLVGRAGSGKSTVARILSTAGAEVIDADRLGHEVTDRDAEVRAALTAEYGPEVYRRDGSLNRRVVAARVFSDPEARGRLDRLVHPRILARIRDRVLELRGAGYRGVVVVDAALLLDWHLERELDAVLAVTAPDADLVQRLMKAREWTAEEARARIAVQRTSEEYAAAADATLVNTGSARELIRNARAAVDRLVAARDARSGERC